MAIDTREERASVLAFSHTLPAPTLPLPTGNIEVLDRLQINWLYRGIPAITITVPAIANFTGVVSTGDNFVGEQV